jgi:hypothetical protein
MANNRGLKKNMANYKISPNKPRFFQICAVVLLLRVRLEERGRRFAGLQGLDLEEAGGLPLPGYMG